MTRTRTCTLASSLALALLAGARAEAACTQAPAPAKPPVTSGALEGALRDAAGQALADVRVNAVPLGVEPELCASFASTRTDAQGRFRFELESGVYCVSALPRGELDAAVSERLAVFPARTQRAELVAVADTLPLEFKGRVQRADGKPATQAFVVLQRREDGATLVPEVDAEGRFRARVPRGTWRALAHEAAARSEWVDRHGPDEHSLALAPIVEPLAPAPAEAVEELRTRLAPAKDGDLGVDALTRVIGDARVVALGDSLRGTHEEQTLVAALFRRLVEQRGFRVLAIDAPFGDVWKLDEFVRGGAGEARALVQGISWGEWNTEELFELVRWMRDWNAGDAHADKIGLVGLDPTHPAAAAAVLQDYFPKVDPIMGVRFVYWVAPFRQVNDLGLPRYEALDEDSRIALKFSITDLFEMFPDVKEDYVKRSSEAEYQRARANLTTIRQCEEILRLRSEGWTTRDRERHMATNVRLALERDGEGSKALVVARNAFAGVGGAAEFGSLGWWLQDGFGAQFVSLGVLLGRGSARVPDAVSDAGPRPTASVVTLGSPAAGSLEDAFASTGKDVGVIDLRALKADGAARRWMSTERARRSLDGAWLGDLPSLRRATPLEEVHAYVWFATVTPSRALGAGK